MSSHAVTNSQCSAFQTIASMRIWHPAVPNPKFKFISLWLNYHFGIIGSYNWAPGLYLNFPAFHWHSSLPHSLLCLDVTVTWVCVCQIRTGNWFSERQRRRQPSSLQMVFSLQLLYSPIFSSDWMLDFVEATWEMRNNYRFQRISRDQTKHIHINIKSHILEDAEAISTQKSLISRYGQ